MQIDSFHLHCVHSVLRVRDGMLVDPFELPAVLRGRKGTLHGWSISSKYSSESKKYVLVDLFDLLTFLQFD